MIEMTEAIARHRVAFETYLMRSAAYGTLTSAEPEYRRASEVADRARAREREEWSWLLLAAPRSAEELAAYAIHLAQVARELDAETEENSTTAEALRALCDGAKFLAGWETLK